MTTGPESPVRDAAVDAAWRAHSLDEPPAQLDATILAAAQAAVAAQPRDARPGAARRIRTQRWWVPLAAAAMISGVVIGVARLVPQNQAATSPYVPDLPKSDAGPTGSPIPPEGPRASVRLREREADGKLAKQAPAATAAGRSIPSPAAAPADASAGSLVRDGATTALEAGTSGGVAASEATRADQPAEPQSASRAEASPTLARETAARAYAQDVAPPDAEARLARIRELYDEGKLTEAAKELIALRAALPGADRRLPPELQKWAATLKP